MLARLRSAITAPPAGALAEAQRHLDGLTKPPGSLGRLEEIAARLTGALPERVTGRGTGVDDRTLARKVDVVRRALAVNAPNAADGLDVLGKVGGFEIAGLVG